MRLHHFKLRFVNFWAKYTLYQGGKQVVKINGPSVRKGNLENIAQFFKRVSLPFFFFLGFLSLLEHFSILRKNYFELRFPSFKNRKLK